MKMDKPRPMALVAHEKPWVISFLDSPLSSTYFSNCNHEVLRLYLLVLRIFQVLFSGACFCSLYHSSSLYNFNDSTGNFCSLF
jgi:hypothetical protein